jgi:hypothetical protein
MNNEVKSKIYQVVNSIEDENVLQMVMEDIVYYTDKKGIIDELNEEELKELDKAISEADNNKTIDWEDLKKRNGWMEEG